jgi:hypothetical protein
MRWFDSFVDNFDGKMSETEITDFDLIIYAQPDKNFDLGDAAKQKIKVLDCTGKLSEAAHIIQI